MNDYLIILGIGIAIGLLDYLIKGIPDWQDLNDVFRGMSWAFLIGAIYILAVFALVQANEKAILWIGVLAIINEDFAYWIFRYIHKRWWKLRPPFNLPVWFYYSYLILINGILIYLFVRF